jgi:hypothetical protein
MEMKLKEVTIGEVSNGYKDDIIPDKDNTTPDADEQVVGYNGKLNIRPLIQTEFVYKKDDSIKVIISILKHYFLNQMYWSKNENGTYEVLDGQQRTISFCRYIRGDFAIEWRGHVKYFDSLEPEEQKQILNFPLQVCAVEGDDQEKLDWFKIVNKRNKELTEQELRNINYTGTWLTITKKYCSKPNCRAYEIGHPYIKGRAIRQEILEIAIEWISNGQIEDYMAKHRHDLNADELISNYEKTITWIKETFPNHREEMEGVPWGILYNRFKDEKLDFTKLEEKIINLMQDDDVTNKKGIYTYVLTGEEKYLSIRTFTPNQKREQYEIQEGICPHCKEENRDKQHFELKEMNGDHWLLPWHKGGHTTKGNCMMLCEEHNRTKAGK